MDKQGYNVGSNPYADSKGVYWRGTDGNVYVKGAQGTNSAGKWDGNTDNYWFNQGYSKISDPVAYPRVSQGAETATPTLASNPSTSSVNQSQINAIRASFGAQKAGLQSQLDTLTPAQQAAERNVSSQFDLQRNALDTGYAQGQRDLNNSANQVKENQLKSLRDIADQVRQQGMSYNNQLGAYGAGNSSAAQLINQALGASASKNRSNVMGQSSQQLGDIGTRLQDLQTSYGQNMNSLNNWKQSQLSEIASKYADQKRQIQLAMANADATQAQQLAQYDASLTQQAIASLGNIENMFKQQTAELNNQYQNMFAPTQYAIPQDLTQYVVNPLDPQQVTNFDMPDAVNPESAMAAILRRRPEDQQPVLG